MVVYVHDDPTVPSYMASTWSSRLKERNNSEPVRPRVSRKLDIISSSIDRKTAKSADSIKGSLPKTTVINQTTNEQTICKPVYNTVNISKTISPILKNGRSVVKQAKSVTFHPDLIESLENKAEKTHANTRRPRTPPPSSPTTNKVQLKSASTELENLKKRQIEKEEQIKIIFDKISGHNVSTSTQISLTKEYLEILLGRENVP